MAFNNQRQGDYILENVADVGYLRRSIPLTTTVYASGAPTEGEFAIPDVTTADGVDPKWRRANGTVDAADALSLALPVWYRVDNTDVQELSATVALYGQHIALTKVYESDVVNATIGDQLYISTNGKLTITVTNSPVVAVLERVPTAAGQYARVRVLAR